MGVDVGKLHWTPLSRTPAASTATAHYYSAFCKTEDVKPLCTSIHWQFPLKCRHSSTAMSNKCSYLESCITETWLQVLFRLPCKWNLLICNTLYWDTNSVSSLVLPVQMSSYLRSHLREWNILVWVILIPRLRSSAPRPWNPHRCHPSQTAPLHTKGETKPPALSWTWMDLTCAPVTTVSH